MHTFSAIFRKKSENVAKASAAVCDRQSPKLWSSAGPATHPRPGTSLNPQVTRHKRLLRDDARFRAAEGTNGSTINETRNGEGREKYFYEPRNTTRNGSANGEMRISATAHNRRHSDEYYRDTLMYGTCRRPGWFLRWFLARAAMCCVWASARHCHGMRIRPSEPVIEPDKPFKHDTLGRREQVVQLCDQIVSVDGPAVIAVDGGFGSGKTVFLKMCAAELKRQDAVSVVEFDAWQQSHTDNPLVNLTAALRSADTGSRKLARLAAQIGWGVAAAATAGVVGQHIAQERDEDGTRRHWDEIDRARREFREELTTIAEEQRVVVFVDELDRCVPKQALDYLNIIRHLFDVPGVTVVVGINRGELQHRVAQMYGTDKNTDVFLRRFYDRVWPLRKPEPSELNAFVNDAISNADAADYLGADTSYTGRVWDLLARCQPNMSLRDMQQTVHAVAAALQQTSYTTGSPDEQKQRCMQVLAFYMLRTVARGAYDELLRKNLSLPGAAAVLHETLTPYDNRGAGHLCARLAALMLLADDLTTPLDPEQIRKQFVDAKLAEDASERIYDHARALANTHPTLSETSVEAIDRLLRTMWAEANPPTEPSCCRYPSQQQDPTAAHTKN